MRNWTQETEDKCSAILNNKPVEEFDMCAYVTVQNRR